MSTPYIGEVRLVGFNFAPADWYTCNGQLLAISAYSTLFNLIGTTFGGDGQATFGLPNLQSRISVHQGSGSFGTSYVIGEVGGVETVSVTQNQIPAHTHMAAVAANATSNTTAPAGNLPGSGVEAYGTTAPTEAMAAGMISPAGGNQPHSNMQPYLALNWIISLYGVYPSQS